MIRMLLGATLFAIAACATPGTEPARSESAQAAAPVADAMVVNNDRTESPAPTGGGAIEVLEAPNAPETKPEEMPHLNLSEPGVVCDKVVETGSILPSDVCRRQADIERRRQQDQRLYDQITRNTAIGISRL
jgi:predicted nucleic acid-binding Zn ribbon protein